MHLERRFYVIGLVNNRDCNTRDSEMGECVGIRGCTSLSRISKNKKIKNK